MVPGVAAGAGADAAAATQVDIAAVGTSSNGKDDASATKKPRSTRKRTTKKRASRKKAVQADADAAESAEFAPPDTQNASQREAEREDTSAKAEEPRADSGSPAPNKSDGTGGDPDAPTPKKRRRGKRGGRRIRERQERAKAKQAALESGQPEPESEKAEPASPDESKRSPSAEPAERTKSKPARKRGGRGRGKKHVEAPRLTEADRAPVQSYDDVDDDDDASIDPIDLEDADLAVADLRKKCKLELIVNVSAGDECRIAVMAERKLEQLFIERTSSQSNVGNIYKGVVTNVEPSIQAAFVDFGHAKNGFLHISDVQPQYFPGHKGEGEDVGRKIPRHQRPPIQNCLSRGQEVIVQITKEGVGTKGPTLTSYISIPGRYLVMMPGMSKQGVSRRIEDEDERKKMRAALSQLELPPGIGFIMRTAGADQTKRELQRDLNYLRRLWKTVVDRVKSLPAPAELYRETDLITRTLRDVYTSDFDRIVVDDVETAAKCRDFLRIVSPRTKAPIEVYTEHEPLFHRIGVEEEIERIHQRHVPLRSGGSLVIESTEAMVTIDVNSGRFRSVDNAEESALRLNVEAAEEIARQLRLRDLGGLIVCDFIDMRQDRNKRKVERVLRDSLKKHKERARILRMSAFGLIEMTRQRQGPSMKRSAYTDCPQCQGSGLVKMPESVILDIMRTLKLAAHHGQVHRVSVTASDPVAYELLNRKRASLLAFERETNIRIEVRGQRDFVADHVEYACEDERGRSIILPGSGTNGSGDPKKGQRR